MSAGTLEEGRRDSTCAPARTHQDPPHPRPAPLTPTKLGSSLCRSFFISPLLSLKLSPSWPEYLWKVVTITASAYSRGLDILDLGLQGWQVMETPQPSLQDPLLPQTASPSPSLNGQTGLHLPLGLWLPGQGPYLQLTLRADARPSSVFGRASCLLPSHLGPTPECRAPLFEHLWKGNGRVARVPFGILSVQLLPQASGLCASAAETGVSMG